ncbi:hypothetical protein EVAR_94256_1 [Eumeta japonica]|uniref:Uncharacterized protein n=1 Tax=Eumeta variegata TaxID=151549 RepID=A0A4C1SRW5_EUMVA|nr:hypothetical protein EVAR_94256_1 [Eumeta japonica]
MRVTPSRSAGARALDPVAVRRPVSPELFRSPARPHALPLRRGQRWADEKNEKNVCIKNSSTLHRSVFRIFGLMVGGRSVVDVVSFEPAGTGSNLTTDEST